MTDAERALILSSVKTENGNLSNFTFDNIDTMANRVVNHGELGVFGYSSSEEEQLHSPTLSDGGGAFHMEQRFFQNFFGQSVHSAYAAFNRDPFLANLECDPTRTKKWFYVKVNEYHAVFGRV